LACEECQAGSVPAEGCLCNGEIKRPGDFCPYGPGGTILLQNGLNGYNKQIGAEINAHEQDTTSVGIYQIRYAGSYTTKDLIKFDLSSLSSSEKVESATLSLYQTFSSGISEVRMYPLLKNWSQTGVTWNCLNDQNNNGCNDLGEISWETSGATGNTDRNQTYSSITMNDTTGIWFNLNVTDAVKSWIEQGRPNYGLLIEEEGGSYHRFTNGADSAQDLRPKLEIKIKSQNFNYDVNSDSKINIIDLALSIYWQGKNTTAEPQYSHLDINEDGIVNWDDVLEIIKHI